MASGRSLSKLFMSTVSVYPVFSGLWKPHVEKLVDNVEKREFSTSIRIVSPEGGGCGKLCIEPCIQTDYPNPEINYVNERTEAFLG